MTQQIRPSVTNPTIATVYNEITSGLLVLAPEFQRRFVWTQQHQEEFLDTIIQGYPFPEIYVSVGEMDVEAMKTIRNVIDGQQRLTTIRNYIVGHFERPLSTVTSYEKLTTKQKEQFLGYEVVVRDLGKIDDKTVREVFRRINLTKFKLDAVEIQNAIYDGEFIQTAKKVVDETDISIFGVFKESEFTRMADLQFALLILATVEVGGYFSQDKEVEILIEKFNEEYPNALDGCGRVVSALNAVKDLALESDSMWFRKSNFYTLVAELALRNAPAPSDFKQKLEQLGRLVMDDKHQPSTRYGQYYSYMYQGTNNRKARVVRAQLLREFCFDGSIDT